MPLGLHHAPVLPRRPRVGRGRRVGIVFAGQDAAGERRVAEHAQTVEGAGRQLLGLRGAVERMIVGLACDRPADAHPVAQRADLGDTPGAVVGHAEIAHLALADQVAHGADRLLERRRVVLLVQIVDVDVAGAEPLQAGLDGAHDPMPGRAGAVGVRGALVGELGGDHPGVAVAGDGAADDPLGLAAGVGVGGVDEVHARVARLADDAQRGGLVGRSAKIHGAEAERGHAQTAPSQIAILHPGTPSRMCTPVRPAASGKP